MSILVILQLAVQLINAIAPILGQLGGANAQNFTAEDLPEDVKSILSQLAAQLPADYS